jgi:alkylhydroperoxidase family enzyme
MSFAAQSPCALVPAKDARPRRREAACALDAGAPIGGTRISSPPRRHRRRSFDAITRISERGVPDEVYEAAADQFTQPELAELVMAIVAINAWNRIAVTTGITYDPPHD